MPAPLATGQPGSFTYAPLVNAFATGAGLKNYYEPASTAAIASGVLAVDLTNGNHFTVPLTAAITTFTIANVALTGNACAVTFIFTTDGTTRAITWPTGTVWPGGTGPTMTATVNKRDIIMLYTVNGGTTWFGFVSGQNF